MNKVVAVLTALALVALLGSGMVGPIGDDNSTYREDPPESWGGPDDPGADGSGDAGSMGDGYGNPN